MQDENHFYHEPILENTEFIFLVNDSHKMYLALKKLASFIEWPSHI